jgi:hypothetical protein
VRLTRKPVLITRFGKAVVEAVPSSTVQPRGSWLGSRKDSIEIVGDSVSPANRILPATAQALDLTQLNADSRVLGLGNIRTLANP